MKICNAYCGIGGNRRLWPEGHDITAVEMNPDIAKIYQDFFPNDTVIVGNAHDYLLEHYKEYDFIWSSPPCPSHSRIRKAGTHRGQQPPIYPDMTLYQEILLLQGYAPLDKRWAVENVMPWYKPLIGGQESGRHLFWSNFYISNYIGTTNTIDSIDGTYPGDAHGFNIDNYKIDNRRKILRNCVDPKLGLHIYNCAFRDKQLSLI